jgi:hypothetical protein
MAGWGTVESIPTITEVHHYQATNHRIQRRIGPRLPLSHDFLVPLLQWTTKNLVYIPHSTCHTLSILGLRLLNTEAPSEEERHDGSKCDPRNDRDEAPLYTLGHGT